MNQPSETSRHLATWLETNVEDYTTICPLLYGSIVIVDAEKLAAIIQEFYDSLP